jgi:CHASE2 domain-containing sensor protein
MSSSQHSPWLEAAHHLFVALFVASVVLLLEHQRLLGWLDSAMLRISSSASVEPETARTGPEADAVPHVVTISNAMFEGAFRERSPLDRNVLAQMIEAVAARSPAVLAIDIDLSPGWPGEPDAQAQTRLDAVLDRIAAAGRTRLVLATPLPSQSEGLIAARHAWMQARCAARIGFGHIDLYRTQRVVLRFDPDSDLLGIVARSADDRGLCETVALGAERSVFLSKAFDRAQVESIDAFAHQSPLNADYFAALDRARTVLSSVDDLKALPVLAGRTVFLGGEYEGRDRFLTAFGEQPGVVVHAAIQYSAAHPVVAKHGLAFALDVLLGTLCGYIFQWSWRLHNRAAAALEHRPRGAGRWARHARARLLLAGNLLLVAALVLALLQMSAAAFRSNLWINPGPMIIGVFVKTLLGSRSGIHRRWRRPQGAGHGAHGGRRELPVGALDAAMALPIIVWALFVLFSH